jgi:hypothetical protein
MGLLALSGCLPTNNKEAGEAAQRERDSLQRIIDQKDTELNDIMGSINEVQEGIRRINEAQGRVTIADGNRESASSKEVIRENMEFIQEAMQQNRDMIAQLKEKLRSSSLNADKLAKAVDNLQKQIDEQAQQIQSLQAELAEKDVQLAEQGEQIEALQAENAVKAETVAVQDAELNKAWFVFGTAKELKDQKILTKGDVLKSGDFNKDYFTLIDIRYDKDIKFYSKSAQLLSTHPAGTYQLVKDKQGQYELHITDPKKFWSVSKYLVVLVK